MKLEKATQETPELQPQKMPENRAEALLEHKEHAQKLENKNLIEGKEKANSAAKKKQEPDKEGKISSAKPEKQPEPQKVEKPAVKETKASELTTAANAAAHKKFASKLENNSNISDGKISKVEQAEKQKSGAADKVAHPHKEHEKRLEAKNTLEADNSEKTIKSAFSQENFKPSSSFDEKAKKEHPTLNELKSKNVYEVRPMGEKVSDKEHEAKGEYKAKEREQLKDIRDKIDAPTPHTVMQKVIGVDTGDAKRDLEKYLNPKDFDGKPCTAHVTGCVAKANDAAPFTKTPQECYDNLRLDYKGTDYKNPNQSVYAVRYTDGTNYDIPYNKEFGGEKSLDAPMTGNGFTASEKHVIPEYTVHNENKKGAIVTDGEIYRINPNGKEELVAYYDQDEKKFMLCNKEAGK